MARRFYKVMLGRKSDLAEKCRLEGFIGADFDISEDLSQHLPDEWREFNEKWIDKLLPGRKSKVSAGLAAGSLWVISKGIKQGDIVLSPTATPGELQVGEVTSDYEYVKGGPLQHRRHVKWFSERLYRESLSAELRGGLGYAGTVCTLDPYGEEILRVLGQLPTVSPIQSIDPEIQDPSSFALEKHLEDFLVENWAHTEIGKTHDILTVDGEVVGQQYQTDTGPIDVLAISKDKSELLVIELKKGKASDNVVGQVQRYMGFVKDMLAEDGQIVRGLVIALEDDLRIRRALSVTQNIDFYRYEISFRLSKAGNPVV
jgi:restriction system protein